MSTNPLDKNTNNAIHLPTMLATHQTRLLPFWCESSLSFDLYDNALARLATKDILPVLEPHWLEIAIEEELALLDENHVLEISVPVLNLCDLMPNAYFSGPALTAKVVGFNGFAAKGNHRLIENFPLADFVLVTDIAGNQYEVVVTKEGRIELPEQGIGLFSIPVQLTFIFSENQVKRGQGLEDCRAQGLEKNKLYLFPPTHINQNFVMHVSVTHLDKNHKRIVDTIRKVSVDYQDFKLLEQKTTTQVDRYKEKLAKVVSIDVDLSFERMIDYSFPYALNVILQPEGEARYHLSHPNMTSPSRENPGWMQHPLFPLVFTKYFGLSAKTLNTLAKKVYSQYDLLRDYLKGERFGFAEQKGYNNFLLRTEAFAPFYDMLIDELVYQRLPKDFLLDRISTSKITALQFSQMQVDFHDSIVLSQLQAEITEGHFYHFYGLFSRPTNVKEHLNLFEESSLSALPKVSIEVIPQVRLSTYLEPSIDQPSTQAQMQPITKNYQTSLALNAAYLAARIRQQKLAELAATKPAHPDAAFSEDHHLSPTNIDANAIHIWYNTPPRSR